MRRNIGLMGGRRSMAYGLLALAPLAPLGDNVSRPCSSSSPLAASRTTSGEREVRSRRRPSWGSRHYPRFVASGRHRQRVLRNQVNYVSGWLLGFGLLGFVIALDPLAVYSVREGSGNGLTRLNVEFVAFFFAISAVGFILCARPHVRLQPGKIVVGNILRDVSIPRDAIEGVDTTGGYVRIAAGGRYYTAAGLEQSNLSHWTGGRLGLQAEEAMHDVAPRSAEQTVGVRWRRPEVPELVLLLLWAVYVLRGVTVA